MRKLNCRVRGLLPLGALLLASSPALAGSWQTGVSYGGSVAMDLYTPTTPATSAGIMLSLHYCGGTAANAHSWFQSLADQYGFYVIAPKSTGNCWDASPGRSGEKAAIAQMIQYVVTNKKADGTRVCSAGASSGACMTQTMLASYPELFMAGAALAGIPVGEWPAGDTSCSRCSQNATSRSAQQWGDLVRNADPGFSGTRPRVQLFHGTSDTTLNYPSMYDAEVAQWTNVFGVSNGTQQANTPKSGWTRTSYTNGSGTVVLQTSVGQGVGHDLTGQNFWADIVTFCGLDKTPPTGTGGTGAGGAATGGKATGGAATGGVATGGTATGGRATGGTATGGISGAASGGRPSGGAPSGGGPTGGASSGGIPSGGQATGGGTSLTGGQSSTTGGVATSSGGQTTTSGGQTVTGGQSGTTGGTSNAGGALSGAGGATGGSAGSPETCSCNVVSSEQGSGAWPLLLIGGLVGLLRRRRRTGAGQ
jgi:acetylxylan esterase